MNETAVLIVAVASVAYLIGYARGLKRGASDASRVEELHAWLETIRSAVKRHSALLVCGQPYLPGEWTDVAPPREQMH